MGGPSGSARYRSPHCMSPITAGIRSIPLGVITYRSRLRAPGSRYVSVVRMPCSTSLRSRSASRLRGHPRMRLKSLKRDEPYQTSRRIRIVQFDVSRSNRMSVPESMWPPYRLSLLLDTQDLECSGTTTTQGETHHEQQRDHERLRHDLVREGADAHHRVRWRYLRLPGAWPEGGHPRRLLRPPGRDPGQLGPPHRRPHREEPARHHLGQRGVGASTGEVPDTIEAAANHAYELVTTLGFDKIDVFSFSMGGFIAQDLIVKHPDLVRRLVLTGTGPRGGKDIDKVVGVTYWDILRATLSRSDPKEFLFFNRNATGKPAAKAFVERLPERTLDRDKPISVKAFRTQLKAIQTFGRSDPSDLSTFTQPTLIANGDNDRMVPTPLSEDLHQRIKGSKLIIYPDSGHGGIFQFHDKFAPVVADFLAA